MFGFLRTCGVIIAALTLSLIGAPSIATAQQPAPAELRGLLDGTFELVEWHHNGKVLRPPEIGGLWTCHNGVVFVSFHRVSDGTFQSLTNYGTYEMTATSWRYQYTRTETAAGDSPETAKTSVRTGLPAQTFTVTREGDTVVLKGNDRREYDSREFRYFGADGKPVRTYRRVR
jgi:hypothetical protein